MENKPKLVLLRGSLHTGTAYAALKCVSKEVKSCVIGGYHHYTDFWVYGLADVWPIEIERLIRVVNSGCFLGPIEIALASHWSTRSLSRIISLLIGKSEFLEPFAATTVALPWVMKLLPLGLFLRPHMLEITPFIEGLSGSSPNGLVFTPHVVLMMLNIFVTVYCLGSTSTTPCFEAFGISKDRAPATCRCIPLGRRACT